MEKCELTKSLSCQSGDYVRVVEWEGEVGVKTVYFVVGFDLPPRIGSKTSVRIGPIWRQIAWQNGRYFQQNRSS
jgi:hypothetical protein